MVSRVKKVDAEKSAVEGYDARKSREGMEENRRKIVQGHMR